MEVEPTINNSNNNTQINITSSSNNNNNSSSSTNNNSALATTINTGQTSNNISGQTNSQILESNYDTDVVRLIGQYLVNKGLKQTASLLLEESGLQQIDHPVPMRFRDHITNGEWDKANQLIEDVANLAVSSDTSATQTPSNTAQSTNAAKHQNGCSASSSSNVPTTNGTTSNSNDIQQHRASIVVALRLAIAEQKFLELIDDNDRVKALRCLRCEITPLCRDVKHIQFLTTLLMCKSADEVRLRANWPGKGQQTRQTLFDKLIRFIPPPIMLPPKRLETLLNQAVQLQRDRCVFHLRNLDPNHAQQPSPRLDPDRLQLDRSNITLSNDYLISQFSKRASVSTIISGQDYLGCTGVCNQFEQHQQQLFTSSSNQEGNGQVQYNHNDVHMMDSADTNGFSFNNTNNNVLAKNSNSTHLRGHDENMFDDHHPIDLKSDHSCSADRFPLQARQQLDSHKDEVWYCKFSNDGQKLATVGLGGKIKIWHLSSVQSTSSSVEASNDTTTTTATLRGLVVNQKLVEKCTLDCNASSVGCLSWSPNDSYLLACGCEDQPHLWIWDISKEELRHTISHVDTDESTTTCSWHLNGERFAAASTKGTFNIYDLDGHRCGSREGLRVNCVSFLHKNPNLLLASDSLNRIKAYELRNDSTTDILSLRSEEVEILEEKYSIMSFVVDRDDKFIAVNIMEQGIHLWDLRHKAILRVFAGVSQRNIAIYSSFSSPDATFLASGSEDGKVYIYHIERDEPVAILNGHSRCVNCVAWNPVYPELLASVSDDNTVRLWGPIESGKSYHLCRSLNGICSGTIASKFACGLTSSMIELR